MITVYFEIPITANKAEFESRIANDIKTLKKGLSQLIICTINTYTKASTLRISLF